MTDEDRAAQHDIAEVLIRYASGIDRRDWDLFATCFTPDVAADYGEIGVWRGVDAITGFMVEAHEAMGHTLHRISNIAIDVDGDAATARSYVDVVLMSAGGDTGMNALGYYDDRLIRTPDGWRIAERRFTTVDQRALPGAS